MRERLNITADIRQMTWGVHACSIYRSRQEQLKIMMPYIASGLKQNERCLCILCQDTRDELCQKLDNYLVDFEYYVNSGQLVFLTAQESYLKEGFFSTLRMLNDVAYGHYQALKDGFYGLRGTGELNWAAEELPGVKNAIDYERQLNHLFERNHLVAICQYDETRVPEDILLNVLYTHPWAFIYGKLYSNPFYIPADDFKQVMDEEHPAGTYQKLRDSIIKA